MREVQAAETDLLDLLEDVENGESIVILRDGRPIARLVPEADNRPPANEPDVFEQIKTFRRTMPQISVEEIMTWRDEGRKG